MPKRWGLLIAIDHYPNLAPEHQLAGCCNDLRAMLDILTGRFGFPAHGLRILRNAEATRAAILNELARLAGSDGQDGVVGRDDVVVIYFAGHGSQAPEHRGYEADGLCETIVPADGRDPAGKVPDIADTEIYAFLLLLNRKTPHVTFVFDSCHSASITRELVPTRVRSIPADTRPLSAVPSVRSREATASGELPLSDRYVLLAACRDHENAFEIRVADGLGGQTHHGAMSYYLCQALSQAPAEASYRDVFGHVAQMVHNRFPAQTPQIEGALDRSLLGIALSAPDPFVLVDHVADTRISLAVGSIHGATAGSEWAIHGPHARHPDPQRQIAIVRLDAVSVRSSSGRIITPTGAVLIRTGMRAFEIGHEYPEDRLRVAIAATPPDQAEVSAALEQHLAHSQWIELLGGPMQGDSDVVLRLTAREIDLPAVAVGASSPWAWVASDPAGQIMLSPKPLDREGWCNDLIGDLERMARYRRVLAVRNHAPLHALRNKVAVRLQRLGEDGRWRVAEPSPTTGHITYVAGDAVAMELENTADKPLYVTVLDFGLSAAIAQIFPPRGASDRLAPGRILRVGMRDGDRLVLTMPASYPPERCDGIEYLKVLVTEKPVDFGVLLQPGTRRSKDTLSSLARRFARALDCHRDLQRLSAAQDQDEWTTIEVPILVTRAIGTATSAP
jgi:hypothetical protein